MLLLHLAQKVSDDVEREKMESDTNSLQLTFTTSVLPSVKTGTPKTPSKLSLPSLCPGSKTQQP
jgi:hypothetical protein